MLRLNFALIGGQKMLHPSATSKVEQVRTTFVLKRRFPPGPDKVNRPPKPLRSRHYVYDLVENQEGAKQPDLKLILTSYVDGVGMKNDVVSVRPNFGRHKLLLKGLAVYASPENLEKLRESLVKEASDTPAPLMHSSRFAELTRRDLATCVLDVLVHRDNPWTIEKFHVRSAFRRSGFWVPDHAITMDERPITGPNMDLEKKVFLVTVKINDLETTPVRCMIRHWSANVEERLPKVERYKEPPFEPVFEEDRQAVTDLPLPMYCIKKSATK